MSTSLEPQTIIGATIEDPECLRELLQGTPGPIERPIPCSEYEARNKGS